MRFGSYEVSTIAFGSFCLDGGAMFGSVPKTLWEKRIQADGRNRIPLALRCLVLRAPGRLVLVDVGMGEKWNDKAREIYALKNIPESAWGFRAEEVTDIILTHLHFDHAGGISRYQTGASGEVELVFPQARVYLQKANLENAKRPNVKERASYLAENIEPLSKAKLTLIDGTAEVLPDIWVQRFDGHTTGQQMIEVRAGAESIVFPSDLVPTQHHLPVPYHLGYDICAATALKERAALLDEAHRKRSIIVFEHDADLAAARITIDARGHYAVGERISL